MKITLSNVGNLIDATTSQTTINSNFTTIQTAFDNTLSRDGTIPNQMGAPIDMNSNRVLNLPSALTANEPVRLSDLSTIIGGGTITSIPAGGNTGDVLGKTSSADYAVGWKSDSSLLTAGSNIVITGTSPATVALTATPTVTSLNKVVITAPATSATLTIANGATLSAPSSATVSGTNTGDQTIILTGDVTGTGTGSFAATIANNAVTNAKSAQMAAVTLKGNPTNATANATDFTIQGLTDISTPSSTLDFIPIYDHTAGTIKKTTAAELVLSVVSTVPTRQTFLSGSGTYTTPANVKWISIRMVGAGGGGGGSGTTPGSGGAGGNTTFSTLTASGGGGGNVGTNTGDPAGSGTNGDINVTGSVGGGAAGFTQSKGGAGGGSYVHSGTPSPINTTGSVAGAAATSNSGSGGSGASSGTAANSGPGGSGGGYLEKIIGAPSATYSYAVGSGGSVGTAGTSGAAGGLGGSGFITVEEHYNY